jgi:benzoyl-CoA reductase/2-hydroxyglutaryl-CoA dehydratase subunit BcrC/BadD/HgdB
MRPEIQEYNFDWMLWKVIEAASKLADGSSKELQLTYDYIPYFKDILEVILGAGKPGQSLLRMLNKYLDKVVNARNNGKKLAMIPFSLSPTIFEALDVVPITMEMMSALPALMWKRGTYEFLDHAGQVGLPETSCSSQRGAMGAYLGGCTEDVDFVVCNMAGACDTNANAFAFAASYLDKPFIQLSYPSTLGDERSAKYHYDDFKDLVKFIEEQSGNRLDEDRLREIINESKKQDEMVADLEDMMCLIPNPVPGVFQLFNYAGRFLCQGSPEYTQVLEDMLEVAKTNAANGLSGLASGKEKLRALLCYIDHYSLDAKFFKWLDDQGITHMGNVLSRHFADNENIDTMIDSLAQMNAHAPMPRMVRGPYDGPNQWLDETLALSKMYNVDCLIYSGTPGCRNTWGMIKPFARDVEKKGYPIHIMYSDAFDDRMESWEATRERLDEFFKIRGLL